jgi:hypothetical protein
LSKLESCGKISRYFVVLKRNSDSVELNYYTNKDNFITAASSSAKLAAVNTRPIPLTNYVVVCSTNCENGKDIKYMIELVRNDCETDEKSSLLFLCDTEDELHEWKISFEVINTLK